MTNSQVVRAAVTTPTFTEKTLVSKRSNVWDVAPLPNGNLLFVERAGQVSLYKPTSTRIITVAKIADVKAVNLGGLMGLTLDPQYSANNNIYVCMNSTAGDVRVVRFKLSNEAALTERRDIVTGITAHPDAYHSGCRLSFGPDGHLWIGTGDGHLGTHAQQPQSLNGKILRVTRDGVGAPDNLGGEFDARVYSYGHRNTQGVAFFTTPKNGLLGLSSEHGNDVEDEVNPLSKGNFGWAPPDPYSQDGVPMTDTARFPDAVLPLWRTGPSQAPSGMAVVNGAQWKGWDGAIALAMLKEKHLKILRLDAANTVTQEERVLVGTYGRLRTAVQGPDGSVYISTDNGRNDKIIRLTPNP